MSEDELLFAGYRRFYAKHFLQDTALYQRLATQGQSPKMLVIACSDARVDPAILLDAKPGDIFAVRNVANLVPPYQPAGETYHGTSAALEFGVNHLHVEHIVILGHTGCAGIKALVDGGVKVDYDFSFISSWVEMAADARDRARQHCASSGEDVYHCCEREGIKTSLDNLLTFPWIKEKVEQKKVKLHGWHFVLNDGSLHVLNAERNAFEAINSSE